MKQVLRSLLAVAALSGFLIAGQQTALAHGMHHHHHHHHVMHHHHHHHHH